MLGSVVVVVPLLGWSWPSLLPIAVAAAAGFGYKRLSGMDEKAWLRGRLTKHLEQLRRVSIPLDEVIADVVGEEVGRDERLVFERDELRLIFRRDPRGKFFVDVLGPRSASALLLRREAEAFANSLVKEFVYNRVMREMEARGINVVKETVEAESGDIVLEARRWH
jgi:hypothetical protein